MHSLPMGLKRVTKKFLKYMIPTLLVLLIIPLGEIRRNRKESGSVFSGSPVRCAIKLQEKMSDGFLTGYCYEMTERLAAHLKDSAMIFLADADAPYLDSLLLDSLDILVVPSSETPAYSEKGEVMSFPIGDGKAAWVVKADKRRQKEIIRWMNSFNGTNEHAYVHDRFFNGYNPYRKGVRKKAGIISPYDEIIKENAKKIGWDWKLFAALVWSESRFRIQASSPRGALGLMQMMPRTADRYDIENLLDPKENIEAGAAYIARLQNKFRDTALNNEELVKFTLHQPGTFPRSQSVHMGESLRRAAADEPGLHQVRGGCQTREVQGKRDHGLRQGRAEPVRHIQWHNAEIQGSACGHRADAGKRDRGCRGNPIES